MEPDKLDQLLVDEWRSAVSSCRAFLERDDLHQVLDFNSWDDLQNQIRNGDESSHREFAILAPGLTKLKAFSDTWIHKVGPRVDTSAIWGFTRLAVKLLQEQKAAIPRILQMTREVCHEVGILNNYFSHAQTFTPELKENCIESAIVILNFLTDIISFLRNDMELIFSTTGRSLDHNELFPLEEKFSVTTAQLGKLTSQTEKLSKFAGRSHGPAVAAVVSSGSHVAGSYDGDTLKQSSAGLPGATKQLAQFSLSTEEKSKPPTVLLPSIRTSRFFDRVDVIQRIEDHFNQVNDGGSFRSLAIHGLGGVGKSTVALRYAENKLQRGELDALFWVHSEKVVSIRQSFTDIAMRLKLPGARPDDHEENHALVQKWLQHTECRWLIVYDNAEDLKFLQEYWPFASRHGQALITTRNPEFGFQLADREMEITNWDSDTGLRFLLHLLSTDISTQLREDEAASAHQLSQKLNGHALAISTMAGLIHRRALSITEFLRFYEQYPSEVHGISGNRSINALWEISFRSLDPQSKAILGILSYVEPDSIPQALFEPKSPADLPASLRFCSESFRFSEAIENLLTTALIKRDKVSRAFSLHRLVQTSFKYFMTPEERQQAFNDATVPVSQAFPRRDVNTANLWLMWEQCALYLQHVISLRDNWREEKKSNPKFFALQTYCDLNNACQRYLLETNSHEDLEDLIQINSEALSTLPEREQTIALQGSLTSHRGQLLMRLGKTEEGVKWLKKSYEIRSHDQPFNPRESAWAADNAATGIASNNDWPEAIRWYELACKHFIEHLSQSSSPNSGKAQQKEHQGEISPILQISMGRGVFWAGRVAQARELLSRGLEQVESTEPYSWSNAANAHFGLGNVERHCRNYEKAEAHFMEAQNVWLKGDQMRSAPFYGACLYRLGCVALDRGSVEAAVKHLRDALFVTEKREHNMVAEHIRVLFKLSEALEQEPRGSEEACKLRDQAERLFRQRAPYAEDLGREETYDSLVCISWR